MAHYGGHDPDSMYVQDCRQVQNDTLAIQKLTGQISRLVGSLEAEKDFERCRKMINDDVRQITETKIILSRIREHQNQAQSAAESNSRCMMYTKLKDNLGITARILEDVIRRYKVKDQQNFDGICATSGELHEALKRVDDDMRCLQEI